MKQVSRRIACVVMVCVLAGWLLDGGTAAEDSSAITDVTFSTTSIDDVTLEIQATDAGNPEDPDVIDFGNVLVDGLEGSSANQSFTLVIGDTTTDRPGFTVTLQADVFMHDGGGVNLDANSLSVASTSEPASNESGTGTISNNVPVGGWNADNGSLGVARTIAVFEAGTGMGTTTQDVGLLLTVPAGTTTGTYTTTITATLIVDEPPE